MKEAKRHGSGGRKKQRDVLEEDKEREFRVISNQVRFGCGYRTIDGKRQYFACHGYPNRNDDFFTTSEITEEEVELPQSEGLGTSLGSLLAGLKF